MLSLRERVAKDPICGMVIDKAGALTAERGGRTYYFCSPGCRRTFEAPEAELKSMRTRVTLALTGVLALAIILIKDDVRDVVASIRLSRATMRKIGQNLFWAFFYNAVAIPVAALGFLNPIVAAAAMALSSLSVIVNAALLKRLRLARLPSA